MCYRSTRLNQTTLVIATFPRKSGAKTTSHFLSSNNSTRTSNTPISDGLDGISSENSLQLVSSDEEPWQIFGRKKKKKEVIKGTKKSDGTLKGVMGNFDLYIGKCDSSVTTDVIINYIKNEANIEALSCTCLNNDRPGVKSFKVNLSYNDRTTLLNPKFWPENIVVRKFYNSKSSKNGRN